MSRPQRKLYQLAGVEPVIYPAVLNELVPKYGMFKFNLSKDTILVSFSDIFGYRPINKEGIGEIYYIRNILVGYTYQGSSYIRVLKGYNELVTKAMIKLLLYPPLITNE